jgi:DNA repair exonuclease SbcCD ATPase subunit
VISRVLLRNWRGYEKLSLTFGPGLTFVIADNGVGKTSLVNGVAWAIFGPAAGVDADASIRSGRDETVAEVDFTIDDTEYSVTRTLRRTGRSREAVQVMVGPPGSGKSITIGELVRRLVGSVGVPADTLPQLMFVPEMRLTHEGQLFADVQDHLSGLLGIDSLRRAARTAAEIGREAEREIRTAREVTLSDNGVDAARVAIETIKTEMSQLDAALVADSDRRRALDGELRRLDQWANYDLRVSRYQAALQQLAAEAQAVGLDPDPDRVAQEGERIIEVADEVRATLATTRAEQGLVAGLVEQLESAEGVCPVCLRALDESTADHASEQHRARLVELEAQQIAADARRLEIEAAAKKISTVASALARLQPPEPPDVPRPDVDEAALVAQKAALDATIETQLGRKGALGEQLLQAEHLVRQVEESRIASTTLAQHHAVLAAASSLAELATAEADARTEQALGPVSAAIADRWAEFFVASPARPRLAGGGSIELGQAGGSIPYGSFSGGEKTLASLLTRLLFVTSASGLRSMWLDEPLEHLDPANRTRLARLLAQVTQPGNHLHQVVVTTYEEALARGMVDRSESTNIVYVSTHELL